MKISSEIKPYLSVSFQIMDATFIESVFIKGGLISENLSLRSFPQQICAKSLSTTFSHLFEKLRSRHIFLKHMQAFSDCL